MKSKSILLSISTFILLIFASCQTEAQTVKKVETATSLSKIEVIQFHSEHRCMTCNKIETLTSETLESYKNISFSLVNVDDKKNEKKAEQFEASGTALFLYNPKSGKKKDLTDFAFMNAGKKEKFVEGLKKEIDQFLK